MVRGTVISVILWTIVQLATTSKEGSNFCRHGVYCITKPRYKCHVTEVHRIDDCMQWGRFSGENEGERSEHKPFKTTKKSKRRITTSWEVIQDAGQRYSVICFVRKTADNVKIKKRCYTVYVEVKVKRKVQYTFTCAGTGRKNITARVWPVTTRKDLCMTKEPAGVTRRYSSGTQPCIRGEPRFMAIIPKKQLNVSFKLSNGTYRYCSVRLMGTDRSTHMGRKDIDSKLHGPYAVFNNSHDGRYRILVECRIGKADQKCCYSLSGLKTVIFGKRDFKGTPTVSTRTVESYSASDPDDVDTLVIALAVLVTGIVLIIVVVVIVCRIRWIKRIKNMRFRLADGREDCEIPMTESPPDGRPIRILLVSEYKKEFVNRFGRLLETNPQLKVNSFDKDVNDARIDLSGWINSTTESCDVFIVLLTKAFINKFHEYLRRHPDDGWSNALYDGPLLLLKYLKKYLTINISNKPVLHAWVVDRENTPLARSRWDECVENSGLMYTLTQMSETTVELHSNFKKLWSVLHERIGMEVPEIDRNNMEVITFLESIKQEFLPP